MDVPHETSLFRRRQPYGWTAMLSLALHVALVAGVVVASTVDACGPRLEVPEHVIAAKLVKLGTPRDPKLLPRKPQEPPPPPPAPREAPVPVAAPEPAAAPAVNVAAPSPTAAAPRSEKPDPTRKLDDIMKRFSSENAALAKAEEAIGALDGDPEGDAERAEEGERYYALVKKRIQDHFEVPSTIPDAERIHLRTSVVIHIDASGRILKPSVEKPSSNGQFDSAVLAGIQRAGSVPPPPDHMRDTVRKGIVLDFRPNQ